MLTQAETSVPRVDYTDAEIEYRGKLIKRLQDAHTMRMQKYAEFNDTTYAEYWESNAKAANSYIEPRKNDQDVRAVSGTTEEKGVTMLSALLNYNLAPDIEAYDKDDMELLELGNVMEDAIKKSRNMEKPKYDQKRLLILKELLDQGTVFAEDTFLEFSIPQKKLKKLTWNVELAPKDIQWDKRMDKIMRYCDTNILTGLNVYLGDIRQFYICNQPYVFTRRIMSRPQAEAQYGKWERWKNVPKKLITSQASDDIYRNYNDWSLEVIAEDMVEEIKYQDKWSNEFMIMLNGVMMLPAGFPLSALNGQCEYTIAKGDLSHINANFAYSKSIPAKTKVDQGIFDEMLRLIVLKTRQSFMPPMVNNTGQTLSKRIFYPGTMTANINAGKLRPLIENTGVSQAEFSAVEFIKTLIDQKSVSPVFEGQSSSGDQTAREIVELKRQSMMKMGVAILGVIGLEEQLSRLRLYNILHNWTRPIDTRVDDAKRQLVDVYQRITVDTSIDGQKGQRIIEFTKELPTPEQVIAEEEIMSELTGKKIRKNYLNPEVINSIDITWYMEITPVEKSTSELRQAMFGRAIAEGYNLFGPQAFNQEHLKRRWAAHNEEDPDQIFIQQPQMPPMQQDMPQEGMPNMAAQLQPSAPEQPSINTLVNA